VEGFRRIAERTSRLGRMKSTHTPATMRSATRRLGERFRDRLRVSSWAAFIAKGRKYGRASGYKPEDLEKVREEWRNEHGR
jgi:hypothetical protein